MKGPTCVLAAQSHSQLAAQTPLPMLPRRNHLRRWGACISFGVSSSQRNSDLLPANHGRPATTISPPVPEPSTPNAIGVGLPGRAFRIRQRETALLELST